MWDQDNVGLVGLLWFDQKSSSDATSTVALLFLSSSSSFQHTEVSDSECVK